MQATKGVSWVQVTQPVKSNAQASSFKNVPLGPGQPNWLLSELDCLSEISKRMLKSIQIQGNMTWALMEIVEAAQRSIKLGLCPLRISNN